MKDQQEELIKIIDEQKEEFAHSMNQLRIQMTQNYRKQKKDLNIAKRQIIRRNEKSVASIIQYIKAGNVINIFFTLWDSTFLYPISSSSTMFNHTTKLNILTILYSDFLI